MTRPTDADRDTAPHDTTELDRLRAENPELVRMAAGAIVLAGLELLRADAIKREREREKAQAAA